MDAKEIIGLDVGQKHTGMARASSIAKLAQPLKTLATDDAANELRSLMSSHEIESIVVGLPRNLKGEDTPQTKWVRQWLESLKKEVDVAFYWQDEALTSSGQKDDHAAAATVILQDFIDSSDQDKVRA